LVPAHHAARLLGGVGVERVGVQFVVGVLC
jgi:hypothetical protein